MLPITSFFAGILGLMLGFLSARVSRVRFKKNVALGIGSDKELERAVRAQANFVEYTPFFLILFALLEIRELDNLVLITAGIVYVFARISHAYGISFLEIRNLQKGLKFRVLGTALTYTLIALMSLTLIFQAL